MSISKLQQTDGLLRRTAEVTNSQGFESPNQNYISNDVKH